MSKQENRTRRKQNVRATNDCTALKKILDQKKWKAIFFICMLQFPYQSMVNFSFRNADISKFQHTAYWKKLKVLTIDKWAN